MRHLSCIFGLLSLVSAIAPSSPLQDASQPAAPSASSQDHISLEFFNELEELSRIVDIAYCVGVSGIRKPFSCASRCSEFPTFELVSTFNTGPLMSDSCGYIAVDHGNNFRSPGRILVAFRGTYSITNTIVDLSSVPQEYVPYPGNATGSGDPSRKRKFFDWISALTSPTVEVSFTDNRTCTNCTVHSGFWTSWRNTRSLVLPHVEDLREKYPTYDLHVVGHSLGGAVSALAGLEFDSRGWTPTVTTFGEPRVGNAGLRDFINAAFELGDEDNVQQPRGGRYRRVTHINDPVPLLPVEEWGYLPHAGEVFISKPSLQPTLHDIHQCIGNEDPNCAAGGDNITTLSSAAELEYFETVLAPMEDEDMKVLVARWGISIPVRYRLWQLFFAHRDYFWRIGLCVPGGDPFDWGRDRYGSPDEESSAESESMEDIAEEERTTERIKEL